MITSLTANHLQIDLSVPECERLADGDVIGGVRHPLFIEAKVDVWPLGEYGGPEWEQAVERNEPTGQFYNNEDLSLYLPVSALRHTLVSSLEIPKKRIHSFTDRDYHNNYLNRLPDAGVRVRLAGSVALADLSTVGYQE